MRQAIADVNAWAEGQGLSADQLIPQINAPDQGSLGGTFAVPVFVIQGTDDCTTPTTLAKDFVDSIQAPAKGFVTIPGGHFAVFTDPEAFRNALAAHVRPLVLANPAGAEGN